ncbi:MAG: acyl-CoA dehydrogenase C-terminal domain-containing protein [Gammaproteobacteria bacterium]|nr:MAG: acyl-CoA dehydrogenase [Gammaproteobacteria bacterium]UCH40477.1 MAG: acyl-CoA dehydrogenase C-terminal domain-containing protein [Gammaproteobacteria bacterium]
MSDYIAPTRDMQFVINEIANLDSISSLPGFEDATSDLVEAVLEQAAVLANEVFSPLNQPGDEHGTRIEDGIVVSPPGYAEAYQQFVENGWQGIGKSSAIDGQGLPFLVHSAVAEMWYGSNMAFALCPLLTSGAIEAIEMHAPKHLQDLYLPRMISGEWSGTMNLTEPQAGTDLAAIKTRAERDGDRYRIRGQKIYITWGEHEMSDNIVHLVLARLPDAPEGVKGISLFLVPKYLANEDGSKGERNDLKVVSVESKMGIHSSPTCVMSYGDNDGAIGYLVGEEHNGLACMFTMMNNARLEVGMQGVAISERACQRAVAFARERVQGVARGHSERSTIIHHPDVRRMLMQMRAITEAGRALAYYASAQTDLAHHAEHEQDRQAHQRLVDLIIPIVKGWCTEMAQESTYLGVQVHGGMGFIEETGAAQHMRDARILTIYEGTTGIQALDLMGRKMLRDKGQAMGELIEEMKGIGAELENASGDIAAIAARFESALDALEDATRWYLQSVAEDPDLGSAVGVDYMMLAGNVTCAWLMTKAALAAQKHIDAGSSDSFYPHKVSTARFFAERILPRSEAQRQMVKAGSASVMAIEADVF